MNQCCATCKFVVQGKNNLYCGNEKQPDPEDKKYVYYSWGTECKLFEKKEPIKTNIK